MAARKTAGAGKPGAKSTTTARGVTVQPLDADGAPTGEPRVLSDATVTMSFEPDDTGIELPALAPGATLEFTTDDPDTVAVVRELTRIPIPTAVVNDWFPAYFRPDPGADPWVTCKVYLTPQGLYVYRSVPELEDFTNGAAPDWYAPVDFAETAKPVTGYAALNAGIPITTTAGKVNVQPYGGCGCSARRLKNWTPSWARTRISWDAAVAMLNPTAGR